MKKIFIAFLLVALTSCHEVKTHFPPTDAPTHYQELKGLEWLMGDWIDDEEDSSLQFSAKWDKHKNFITEHFIVSSLDEPEFEGQQIIAWDPENKQIRSWVFDSDGGFGEGKWSKTPEGWTVDMTYTLPDGRKATSDFLYSHITEGSYTWQSTNRQIEGELLPNIEPVTVMRKK